MLERIWSGWRANYVDGRVRPAGGGAEVSPFTQILESGESDVATHVVHRGELVFAIMNIHPYTSGHLLVLPYREVPDLADLTGDETTELWSTVTDAVAAVRAAYAPDGLNVGLNLGRPAGGSVPSHLHVHVVPRWTGDSNFMSSIANTQTLPESLAAGASRLRATWPYQLGSYQLGSDPS
ncbi:HIT family protein [Ilumatobacter sp.]|uniref:HIT family protein n=1 Tax=Ilumatobacter sp. TaxID=1967498 RepID=UPI003C4639B6